MDQTVLQILLQLKDEASDGMKKFSGSLKDAEDASKGFALGLHGVGVAAVGSKVRVLPSEVRVTVTCVLDTTLTW